MNIFRTKLSFRNTLIFLLAGASFIICSCAPDAGLNDVSDYDVVVTLFDRNIDFSTFETFGVLDSVVHFQDPDNPDYGNVNREYDDLILSETVEHLKALGYVVELGPQLHTPDVFVTITVASVDWISSINDPYDFDDLWGWYPDWPDYDPEWEVQYPYYSSVSYQSYSTGTILIQMLDMKNRDYNSNTIPVVWVGAINGILEDSAASLEERITQKIEQCFTQSPYLGTD